MEEKNKLAGLPLDYIRGLLVRQGARCAITGLPLVPVDVNADHILPLSRTKLSPTMGKENVWLVHKSVNAMKGTLTYDELVEMARLILAHHDESKKLLREIQSGAVQPCKKDAFDRWVTENCVMDGRLKNDESLTATEKSPRADA
jgi:hypothetical protein